MEFNYRIFNQDGGEVAQCGNGARCFARFVHAKGLTENRQIMVSTLGGTLELALDDSGQVTVDMGAPKFEPAKIPLIADQQQTTYSVELESGGAEFFAVSMGNPHAVLQVDDVDAAPVDDLGPELQTHAVFPQQANIGFMQVISRDQLSVACVRTRRRRNPGLRQRRLCCPGSRH